MKRRSSAKRLPGPAFRKILVPVDFTAKNQEALANPEALDFFRDLPDLQK